MAEYGQDPISQPGGEETTTPITIEGVLDKIAEAFQKRAEELFNKA